MRKRANRVEVHFDDAEYRYLKSQVQISGLTTEAFIRNLVAGQTIKPKPTEDFRRISMELSAIGNNVNQIARFANSSGFVKADMLESIRRQLSDIWKLMEML